MLAQVTTWNVFHGQTSPPDGRDHFDDFAAALARSSWDVCALQELPPWWATPLGLRCGASVRVARTSRVRALAPGIQRTLQQHARAPGLGLGTAGAAVNAILVRPSAGIITGHSAAPLRRFPQRRSVHAVRLQPVGAPPWWFANVHCHNRPPVAAALDTARALRLLAGWAGAEPALLAGDLNLPAAAASPLARDADFRLVGGHRVDHVLARGIELATHAGAPPETARAVPDPSAQPGKPRTLADHRLLTLGVKIGA